MVRQKFGLILALSALCTAIALPQITAAAPARPENVVATQPTRILDTRIGLGARTGPMVPGVALSIAPPAGNASALALNITATDAAVNGWVKVWPCDQPQPSTSSLNFTPGRATANAAMVRVASAGICLATSAPVQLVVDVTGYYTGTDDFSASPPNRLLDTRVSNDPLQAGVERRLRVAGTAGVGAGATIAALNLTVDRPARAGWVVAYPCGQQVNGSTVNFSAGDIVANLTLVALSGGDVCIRSMVDVQIVVDGFGWSSGNGALKVQSPTRLLDTRESSWGQGPAQSGNTIELRVAGVGGVPNSADAALLTVTVANPGGSGFVTVWPCDEPFPTASVVNTFPNGLISNLVMIKLSEADGLACLRYMSSNLTSTELVVDAVGWVTGTASRGAPVSQGPAFCGLSGAAFCETFDAPAGNGGKTGDLDPVLWGVSRLGDINPGQKLNTVPYTSMQGCGSSAFLPSPNDVRICNGQMFETVNDGGGVTSLHTYPKQPFNFAGRTGRVVFDVSGDSDGTHGAWPEFFITDKPIPGMRGAISGMVPPMAHNSIGFALAGCSGPEGNVTGVSGFYVTKNGAYSEPAWTQVGCVTKGSSAAMNHIEVRVSTARMEVWGTDAGSRTLKLLAYVENLGLTFTQGLVWLNDVHYNARKAIEPCACGTQWNHTFVWDNLGFDGPKTYRDLGFDVPDVNSSGAASWAGDPTATLGYQIGTGPTTLTVTGVRRDQAPTGALVVFNAYSFANITPEVSVNGGPYRAVVDRPTDDVGYTWRTYSIPLESGTSLVDGTNTLTFRSASGSTVVSNVSVILVAGAAVP